MSLKYWVLGPGSWVPGPDLRSSVTVLQSETEIITNCGRFYKVRQSSKVWQKVITKCGRYYKVRQVSQSLTENYYKSVIGVRKCDKKILQSMTGITKCNSYYKVRRNRGKMERKSESKNETLTSLSVKVSRLFFIVT